MDGLRPRPEPLTDAEHIGRVRDIRDQPDWAREHRLATDQQHLADQVLCWHPLAAMKSWRVNGRSIIELTV